MSNKSIFQTSFLNSKKYFRTELHLKNCVFNEFKLLPIENRNNTTEENLSIYI